MTPLKREITKESTQDDQHNVSPNKLPKNQELGIGSFPESPAQHNPLDESRPLGLQLGDKRSLLESIQMKLSEEKASSSIGSDSRKGNQNATTSAAANKLKVSKLQALLLKIGSWEYKPKREWHLVVKCYFARQQLIWELMDGRLKNKIEIEWSDIVALKATYLEDGPDRLDVVLSRKPLFFREKIPQPRMPTAWQSTADFTGGQASLHRLHYLQCSQGLLGPLLEKLSQCNHPFNILSPQEVVELKFPYFGPVKSLESVSDVPNETNESDLSREGQPTIFDLNAPASGGELSSSRSELHDPSGIHAEFSQEAPSHSSCNLPPTGAKMAGPAMDTSATEGIKRAGTVVLNDLSHWDRIKVPGIDPSMSLSELVNNVENTITTRRTSSNHPLSHEEEQESLRILEDISQCLLNHNQYGSTPEDALSVMSKIDSLCSLLQKDPTTFYDLDT